LTNDFLRGPKQRPDKDGKAKMKAVLVLVALCFSASAFAQASPPKVGNKPLVQVKQRASAWRWWPTPRSPAPGWRGNWTS
jgi:hypothetical protein